MSSTNKTKNHLGFIDGLRAIAALYVVAHHIDIMYDPTWSRFHGVLKQATGILRMGHTAVDWFIVLSGFCLMLPVIRNNGELRGGKLDFFVRRCRRILPPYYFALLASVVVVLLVTIGQFTLAFGAAAPVTLSGFLTHLLLIHDLFPANALQINGPLWSIAVEWRIYLLFPTIVYFWRKAGPYYTISAVVIVSVLLCWLLPHLFSTITANDSVGPMPQYLALFGLGALAAGVAFSPNSRLEACRSQKGLLLSAAIFFNVVAFTLLIVGHLGSFALSVTALDFLVGIGAALFMIVLSNSPSHPLRRLLSIQPLTWLGSFAYSIYLIHDPVIQTLQFYLERNGRYGGFIGFLLVEALGLGLVIAAARLFYLVAEKPYVTAPSPKRKG